MRTKMTNQDKVQAYAMRLEGQTLQEIAEHFGVTREWIRQILPGVKANACAMQSAASCVYPNLAAWLVQNKCSYNGLAQLAGTSQTCVQRLLAGSDSVSKQTIDRVLSVAGMTYEEAFAKEETPPEQKTTPAGSGKNEDSTVLVPSVTQGMAKSKEEL